MQCETNLIVVDSNLLHKLACLFNLEELKFREESWTQAQAHADDGVHRCKVCNRLNRFCPVLETSFAKTCSFLFSLYAHIYVCVLVEQITERVSLSISNFFCACPLGINLGFSVAVLCG